MTLSIEQIRHMVRDSITCASGAEFLASWFDTLAAHPEIFARVYAVQGDAILGAVRAILVTMQQTPEPVAPVAKNGAPAIRFRAVILDPSGKKVESKGFSGDVHAEAWAARKLCEMPGHSALVAGRPMTRDQALGIAYGRRSAGPTMAKAPRHSGPWQKASQTRVVLPKG